MTTTKRSQHVQIWFTYTPESAIVRSRTIFELRDIEKLVFRYAKLHWEVRDEENVTVHPYKVDIARDFKGAFLPFGHEQTKIQIKDKLQEIVTHYSQPTRNLLFSSVIN